MDKSITTYRTNEYHVRALERDIQQQLDLPIPISLSDCSDGRTVHFQSTTGESLLIESRGVGCKNNKNISVIGMKKVFNTTLNHISVLLLPVCPHGSRGVALSLDFIPEKVYLAWVTNTSTPTLSRLPLDVIEVVAMFLCPENITFYFSRGCPTTLRISTKTKLKRNKTPRDHYKRRHKDNYQKYTSDSLYDSVSYIS